MVECNKASVKLADSQVNKLNPAAKNRRSLTLKMNIKCLMEIICLMNYH